MKKNKPNTMSDQKVRVIKLGTGALAEFIYEKLLDDQETYFDIDPLSAANSFYIDWDTQRHICCVYKAEDDNGNLLHLPANIDLRKSPPASQIRHSRCMTNSANASIPRMS